MIGSTTRCQERAEIHYSYTDHSSESFTTEIPQFCLLPLCVPPNVQFPGRENLFALMCHVPILWLREDTVT